MHEEKIIFGTPLVLYPINDKTLNKELEKLALHQLKTQPLKVLSNVGGKQTHAPDLNHPILQKFFNTISPFLDQFVSMYDFLRYISIESYFHDCHNDEKKSNCLSQKILLIAILVIFL